MSGSLSKWVVASDSGGSPPNSDEVVIGQSGDTRIVHDHADPAGGNSNQSPSNQVTPVSSYISEGPTRWLGLRSESTAHLDGTGLRPIQAHANHSNLASRQVVGQVTEADGVGTIQLESGYAQPCSLGARPLSLASEATSWLEARNPVNRSTERTGPPPLAGIDGPATSTGEIATEEREFTPEDFWSLLRDAGYEVW